jgi:hypothetical protein
MKIVSRTLASVVVLASAGLGSAAHADTFTFDCISNNNAPNCQAGELQLGVEVVAGPAGQAQFIFRNTGSSAASITDIYFDNGTLLGIASVTNGAGVDFSQGASPGNLPGGNSMYPAFQATAGFTADSNPPTQSNGVNPGETVSIFFTLQSGGAFADVIRELYSREIRIGVHVQGFANGGSESFVNLAAVPVPAAAWLLVSGLGLLRVARHRKPA